MDARSAYYTLVCDQTPSSDYWSKPPSTKPRAGSSPNAVGVLLAVLTEASFARLEMLSDDALLHDRLLTP